MHRSLFGPCECGVAFWLFWRPLRDVSSSDGEENLSSCLLGAFSVLPVWLVQLNRLLFFLYLKVVFKMLFCFNSCSAELHCNHGMPGSQ